MVSTRHGLLVLVTASAVACQNNTVELADASADASGSDTGTSVAATLGSDDADTGLPSLTTTVTTEPVPTTTATTATGDSGPIAGIEDGWWHLALDTGEPGLPFQFVVWAEETSPGIWSLTCQSLALDVGSETSPRHPVGETTTFSGLELGEGLPFQFYTGLLTIPGEANPINGTAVTIDAFFDGIDAGDPYCGDVRGSVVEPVQADLAGSTFATTRIPEPQVLPESFPTSCP